jgi:hypothetical protein
MKKILFALTIGFTSITALSTCVYAQNSVHPIAFNDTKALRSSVHYVAALENPADMGTYIPDAKKINAKRLKTSRAGLQMPTQNGILIKTALFPTLFRMVMETECFMTRKATGSIH